MDGDEDHDMGNVGGCGICEVEAEDQQIVSTRTIRAHQRNYTAFILFTQVNLFNKH